MLTVPPALLKMLDWKAGAQVGVGVDGRRLVVEAAAKPRYTLAELLAASNYKAARKAKDQEWHDAPAVGKEFL